MRRHDLAGKKGETDPRELSLRGLEQEPDVECAGPRTLVVLDGVPEPAAGKRDHAEIDEVVASAPCADGAAHDALDPRAQAPAPERPIASCPGP